MNTVLSLDAALSQAIDRARLQGGMEPVPVTADTPLLGDESILDSASFVMLMVDIETILERDYGIKATLTENEAIVDPDGPFKTFGGLSKYIHAKAKLGS